MTLSAFSAALQRARGLPLAFTYDGRMTKKGYHVTELKSARITGLDCGANVESWSETIFQVLDIEDSITGQFMTVDKLAGIIAKYGKLLGADPTSKISFEVSDGGDAMRIFAFGGLEVTDGRASIRLVNRVSACKPLVRGIITPVAGKNPCGPRTAFSDEIMKA